jgi:hypothetical protein
MEEKYVDLWWDAMQDIERSIEDMREMKGYTCLGYLKWKRSYHHLSMNF